MLVTGRGLQFKQLQQDEDVLAVYEGKPECLQGDRLHLQDNHLHVSTHCQIGIFYLLENKQKEKGYIH